MEPTPALETANNFGQDNGSNNGFCVLRALPKTDSSSCCKVWTKRVEESREVKAAPEQRHFKTYPVRDRFRNLTSFLWLRSQHSPKTLSVKQQSWLGVLPHACKCFLQITAHLRGTIAMLGHQNITTSLRIRMIKERAVRP